MSTPVKVQIFGQTYSIHGELDATYVQRLATYVDEKMQAIASATATIDTHKVAVLAALAIADELNAVQDELRNAQSARGEHDELLREQAERCLSLVERALKQTA